LVRDLKTNQALNQETNPNQTEKKLRSNSSNWGFFISLSKLKLTKKDCHTHQLKRLGTAELTGKSDFHALRRVFDHRSGLSRALARVTLES